MINPVVDKLTPTNHRVATTVLYNAMLCQLAGTYVASTRGLLGLTSGDSPQSLLQFNDGYTSYMVRGA